MTIATQLYEIAQHPTGPNLTRLVLLASQVARMERTLDEIAADAQLVAQAPSVKRGRFRVVDGGRAA